MQVIPAFQYMKVHSIADAQKAYHASEDAQYYAGGHAIIPALKHGAKAAQHLIDLKGIDSLHDITVTDDSITIGSLCSYETVIDHAQVGASLPCLVALCQQVADAHIRRRATVGGALVDNDIACDWVAACLALEALLITDSREIAFDDWLQGGKKTALQPGEILTAIRLPTRVKGAYFKKTKQASHYPIVGVFVAKHAHGRIRVGITATAKTSFSPRDLESKLSQDLSIQSIDQWSIPREDLISDQHGQADYRAHLIRYALKQCLRQLS